MVIFRTLGWFFRYAITIFFLFHIPQNRLLFQPHQYHRNVYISSDFSLEQQHNIQQALTAWVLATHGAFRFNLVDPVFANLFILDLPSNNPTLLKLEQEQTDKAGVELLYLGLYVNDKKPTIYIVSQQIWEEETFLAVVEHELGHSFGLDHNPDKNTLMYYSQNESSKYITLKDIKAFCQLHRCD